MGDSYDDYCDMIDSMDWIEPLMPEPMNFDSCEEMCCPSEPHNDEADAIEDKEEA